MLNSFKQKITIATVKLVGNFGKAYHHILRWVLQRFCNEGELRIL